MAAVAIASPFGLQNLFKDISPKFDSTESKNVVQSFQVNYGGKFCSLGSHDLLQCLQLLAKHGYVSRSKVKLIEDYVAPKSSKEELIKEVIRRYKASRPAVKEEEFQGRDDEIKDITKQLESKETSVLNLFGSSGVGKTRLANEVCSQWRGNYQVFDLREVKSIKAMYYHILSSLELAVPVGFVNLNYAVTKVRDRIKTLKSGGHSVLFFLDNVDKFTAGQEMEGKSLKSDFIQFLEKLFELDDKGERCALKLLLTSRIQFTDATLVDNFEVMSLERSSSEKILFPEGSTDVQVQQKDNLIGISKGFPIVLKGMGAILRQERKSVDDLIARVAATPEKSKLQEDAKEMPVSFEDEGVDTGQISVIREMFSTLPSDRLKVSAVVISLFHGPFTVETAAKVLGIDQSEAFAQLEGLVTSAIISVVDEEAKERKYDIHPLLQKYADSIKSHENFSAAYMKAKGRYYELFMSKMAKIAKLIEPQYVKAFSLFETDRANFEFALEISLQPEYYKVPREFHENALIASLFMAMLTEGKMVTLFHSWAEICEDDGKSGSLGRTQLKCWEARQVADMHGTEKAFVVLEEALRSMEKVEDKSTESFKLTRALYLHTEGEILWRDKDFKKALESLQLSLTFSEELLKEHTDLARCYNAVGNCFFHLGQPMEALEFYEKAYKMQERLAGSEHHFDMPMYKNQIGTAYEGLRKYDKAVEYYRDALRLLKELNLSGFQDEAHFCRNLANALMFLKKYSEATEPSMRAYTIRKNLLKNHPHTVRSIFQRAVLQANLRDFGGALKLFLEAWEMEKSLEVGNHSRVWRKIITGVEDFLNEGEQKKTFQKDAFKFCEHFWIEKKKSQRFAFSESNKEIIDTLMHLVSDEKDKYELQKEQLWFYEGMYNATKEEHQDCELEPESSALHKTLGEMTKLLEHMIHLCKQLEDHKKEELYADELQVVQDGRVPEVTSRSKAREQEKSAEVVELSSTSADQDSVQKEEVVRNADKRKTVIKRGKIEDESETWNLAEAGASITFNLGTMTKSLTITCSLWGPGALSPPIGSNELLVSNVIELSHDGPPDLEFMENAPRRINVALLHSASNFKGYEVVIKQLVDPENNEWKALETTNIWRASVNSTVPNWMFPFAEATCRKTWFSSFAVVWRLKSFVFPKLSSVTQEFICSVPDYPNVTVAIPWNSLPAATDFRLTLKVQEAPSIDHDMEGMFVGPILHISYSHDVKLSEPAKISVPLALTDSEVEPVKMPYSGQLRILHFKSREKSEGWTDITDHLEMPAVIKDGIVTFQVKTLCRFWPWWLKTSASFSWKYVSPLYDSIMKQHAGFLACLCSDTVPERYLLYLFCFPQHLRSRVNSDISSTYFVNMQGEGTSQKPLSNGDETFVSLSNGFEVHGAPARNAEEVVLKFLGKEQFQRSLRVNIKDVSNLQVDFLKLMGGQEKKNSSVICQVPIIPRSPVQVPTPTTFDFKEGNGTSAQSVQHSSGKRPSVESSSGRPIAALKKRRRLLADKGELQMPSDEDLEWLSQRIAQGWKPLGRRLDIKEEKLTAFHKENEEYTEKAYKMLLHWKQKTGSAATFEIMYNALCHECVNRKDLAETFFSRMDEVTD